PLLATDAVQEGSSRDRLRAKAQRNNGKVLRIMDLHPFHSHRTREEFMKARKRSAVASSKVERIAQRHEALHQEQLQRDKKRAKSDSQNKKNPAPTTKRGYPAAPLPKKTIAKPGVEAEVEPGPSFSAPEYRGSEKLAGKVAIVTGGGSGIRPALAGRSAPPRADR